jgi:hypothetical protein
MEDAETLLRQLDGCSDGPDLIALSGTDAQISNRALLLAIQVCNLKHGKLDTTLHTRQPPYQILMAFNKFRELSDNYASFLHYVLLENSYIVFAGSSTRRC